MNSFQELNLNPLLLRAIEGLGYVKPSPIQAEALPILLDRAVPTDFLGLAATGTGKTAAFAIPLLERIDPARRTVQALVLCPTRELAQQVSGQISLLGKHMGILSIAIYGGASYGDQIYGLKRGANVVVGTPGRLVDHLTKGTLRLDDLQVLVLDEADEMISMGFKDDLEAILNSAPRESSNTWLFSATMSSEVRRIADGYLVDPRQVQVNRTETLPEGIEQLYYKSNESDKPEILCKLIDAAEDFYGLVFCQTKALVVDLTQYLRNRGYSVDCLHGDMEQDARTRTMKLFRDRRVQMLVCTDVASRGLDVKDITHVINYSLPRELDNYVHRIGRTARIGKVGVAMSLVTPSHKGLIPRIERMTRSKMREGRIPTRKEIGARRIASDLTRFMEEAHHSRAVELLNDTWKEALASMNPEEIAGRFIALMHPEIFGERTAQAASAQSKAPPLVAPLSAPMPMQVAAFAEPMPAEYRPKAVRAEKTQRVAKSVGSRLDSESNELLLRLPPELSEPDDLGVGRASKRERSSDRDSSRKPLSKYKSARSVHGAAHDSRKPRRDKPGNSQRPSFTDHKKGKKTTRRWEWGGPLKRTRHAP